MVAFAAPAVAVAEVDGIPVPTPRPERAFPQQGGNVIVDPAHTEAVAENPEELEPGSVVVPEPRPEQRSEDAADQTDFPPDDNPHKLNAKPAAGAESAVDAEQTIESEQPEGEAGGEASLMPPPRPSSMPAAEIACRQRLTELGASFEELPQLADATGCSVPWPISVTALSRTVELAPAAQLNCATALAAAEFVAETIAPKAREVFDAELIGIRQDSAYVCRPRNGSSKLSEHAFGNAMDIGAFTLSDERQISVGAAASPDEAAFMMAVRVAACGPFKTVLGPGSDADHATHLHFDLASRRAGSTFCQ